ncbi:unannotated protein [freshwater metagenome]|uniref:Unannotated protein n=2 Tax=freshwater metagenome TaxID=449393 RepID=A0A6J7K1X6_9ZZZZ
MRVRKMKSTRKVLRAKTLIHDEGGSISVLITSLFLLVFILSVGIIDVSDSYLAKRELIQIGEDSILVASHSLNESLYYSESLGLSASNGRVPIDCTMAEVKFRMEISSRELRKNEISVSGWRCSGDQITASISSNIQALVNFPILVDLNNGQIGINAIVGATSELSLITT